MTTLGCLGEKNEIELSASDGKGLLIKGTDRSRRGFCLDGRKKGKVWSIK